MNCLWLLVLLFFCGNNNGCGIQSRENDCGCGRGNHRADRRDRDDDCGCERNSRRDERRDRDDDCARNRDRRDDDGEDCGCMNTRNESRLEPRTFTSFNSSSCGCEN